MSRPIFTFVLPLFALLLVPGCPAPGGPEAAKEEKTKEAVGVQASPVRTASFARTVRAVGTASSLPGRQILVSPAVEGVVSEILVSLGDRVKQGQPLVRLDDRLARHDLEEKKLARAEMEASLALLKALPREPDRRAADLEIERAKVAVELAKAAMDRLEPLHERKEVSDPQLYEAKQKLEEATISQRGAEARRDILLQGPRPEAVAEAEAKIAQAASAVKAAETRLAFHALEAPREGTVTRILCRPGQGLKPGDVAVEVLDPSEVLVTAGVPPRDIAGIEEGMEAKVTLRGLGAAGQEGGEVFTGKVSFVGPEAIASTGAIPVGVKVPNPTGRLRLGVAVSVEIVLGEVAGVLAVPEEAIVPAEAGPTLVVIRDGKAAVLSPRVGLRGNGLVEVAAEGLKAGEPVITVGGYNLPEGTPVTVEEGPPGEKAPKE